VCCRSIQGERTEIGKHVCVCLLGGHVSTLFFLDKNYINFSEVSRPTLYKGSRVSSGSIVSDYGLDDRAIGRSGFDPRQGKRIFPLSSVSRPALGPTQPPVHWVPGVLSRGVKRGRGVMLTTHPHLVPRSWMSRSYVLLSPQAPPWRVEGLLYLLLHYTSNSGASGEW
jgi:hypothetical protein